MSEFTQPRDVLAERAVVGCVLAAGVIPDGVVLDRDLFWEPHLQGVVTALQTLSAKGQPCDPITVRAELLRAGNRGPATDGVWLVDLMHEGCLVPQLGHYLRTLRELLARREVITAAVRGMQEANNPATDPYDVAAHLYAQALSISERGDPTTQMRTVDVLDFVKGQSSYDWLVPGLLERGDRLLLTGGEGMGKSVLCRMLAVTTAAGVHPFRGTRVTPGRVLLVDLENGDRLLRRMLRPLLDHAERLGSPIAKGTMTIESRPRGLDLLGVEDQTFLRKLAEQVQPDLLVIGPLYRMHYTDMNDEVPARTLTRVIDGIRTSLNCAVVIETHAAKSPSGTVRSLSPKGSQVFSAWPDFGYGLRQRDDDGTVMNFVAWRGARDERAFPRCLARGGPEDWPWVEQQDVRPEAWT